MAKRTLFVLTHLGSGWEALVERLNRHPRVQVYSTGTRYAHPDDVRRLRAMPHKHGGAAAVWGDVILHNKDFAMRRLCHHYRVVVWTRRWEETAAALVGEHGYGEQQAADYYNGRLFGIQEYWGRRYERARREGRHDQSPWNPDLEDDAFLAAVL